MNPLTKLLHSNKRHDTSRSRRRLFLEPLERRQLLATGVINGAVLEDGAVGGIESATVYLDENNNGVLDSGENSTVTGPTGAYQFDGLAAGNYTVAQLVPDGWLQTTPTPAATQSLLGDVQHDIDLTQFTEPLIAVARDANTDVLYALERYTAIHPIDPATGQAPAGATAFALPTGDLWDITYDSQTDTFWGVDPVENLIVQFEQSSASSNVRQQFQAPNPMGGDPYPVGIALDTRDNTLWVVDRTTQEIYHVDSTDGSLIAGDTFTAPGTEGSLHGLAFDGLHLWTNRWGESNQTLEFDSSGQLLRTFDAPTPLRHSPSGPQTIGVAFGGQAADGSESLWLANYTGKWLMQVDVTTPGAHIVSLADGQIVPRNFSDFQLGTVSGLVQDDQGSPLDGWLIFVDGNSNGELEGWESTAVTQSDGGYLLDDLRPGQHSITAKLREPGWAYADPSGGAQNVLIVASEDSVTANFTVEKTGDFRPVGAEFLVAPGPAQLTTSELIPHGGVNSAAMDDVGNSVVVWQSTVGSQQNIYARWHDASGSSSGEILVNTTISGQQRDPMVAIASDTGSFVVVWTAETSDTRSVLGQRFLPGGQKAGGEFAVFSGTSRYKARVQSIAMDSNGDFAVLYQKITQKRFTSYNWEAQRYNATAERQGNPIEIDPTLSNGSAGIAMNDAGDFVVAWDESPASLAQRYNASGQAIGSQIVIGQLDYSRAINVVMDATGGFAVTWDSAGRIYDANGQVVTDFAHGGGPHTAMAMQANGDFVLAWSDGETFAQRFTNLGVSKEGLFQVNTSVVDAESQSLGVDANGNLLIAWTDASDGVFAQRYETNTISNTPPVADPDAYDVLEDGTLNIAAPGVLANDSDGDQDSLTAHLVADATSGSLTLNEDGSFSYSPDLNFAGTDSFTYKAFDGVAFSNPATVTVTVTPVNDAPVAVDNSYSVQENDTLTVAASGVLGNDTDVDGDSLSAVLVTDVSSGSLTLNAGGSFTYTPNDDFYGTDSFTYKADDGPLESNVVTVTITVTEFNNPPVAGDDNATTAEDAAVDIDVLANDTDEDALTVDSVTQGTHGTVVNNGTSVTYTPDSNFFGADSFTYTVSDGKGGSDVATVTVDVTPVNDAPVAVNDSATTDEDVAATIDVFDILVNDSDVDGDTLSVTAVGTPSHGSVALNPDDTITYTPHAGFSGTDSFTYTIDDGNDGTAVGTVDITVDAAVTETEIYVYEIRFVQHDRKADWWQAIFEIRSDSNGNDVGDAGDAPLAGVDLQVNFAGTPFSGTTDSNGLFTTSWVKKLQSGQDYYANVVDMALTGYVWDHLLDLEDDTDGDGDVDGWLNF